MSRNPNPEVVVGVTCDNEFGPCPDYESAVEVILSKIAGLLVKRLQLARREEVELKKGSQMISVRGFDNKLPDNDIKTAIANHFSSCGEIVDFNFVPVSYPKSYPDRFVSIHILGEGAKEKAEQLNGSDLGGCKLVVRDPLSNPTAPLPPMLLGPWL